MSDFKGKVLCRLDDIPDGGSKGFEIGEGPQAFEFFVVRKGERLYAYENSCPHTGGPLDWTPHGALFRFETGQCLVGPCIGDWLRALRVFIDGENIILAEQSQ